MESKALIISVARAIQRKIYVKPPAAVVSDLKLIARRSGWVKTPTIVPMYTHIHNVVTLPENILRSIPVVLKSTDSLEIGMLNCQFLKMATKILSDEIHNANVQKKGHHGMACRCVM